MSTAITQHIQALRTELPENVTLVCVSKFHPVEAIREAYEAGERHFGESRVQELKTKIPQLPTDIHWHFIGHLQTNKVRDLLKLRPYLIHSVACSRCMWRKKKPNQASLWKKSPISNIRSPITRIFMFGA